MAPTPSAQNLLAIAALSAAVLATVFDLSRRRIPNWLTGFAVVLGLLLHLAFGGFSQLGWAALAGLVAGGLFFPLFLAGGMGAGDVKLIAALACILGIGSVRDLLLATVISGGIVALAFAALKGALRTTAANALTLLQHHRRNGLRPHTALNLRNTRTLRMPYALPIALGALWVVSSQFAAGGGR